MNQGTGHRHYLGVLIDFGSVLLITINIQSNGGPCTPGATQSEDDTRTICKYKPQALEKDKQRVFPQQMLRGRLHCRLADRRDPFGDPTLSIGGLDP